MITTNKIKQNRSCDRGGFSLVETLVVIGIFVILSGVIGRWGRDLWVQNAFMQNSLLAESEARGALKNIIAELRAATTGNNGSYPIQLATSTAVTFFSDLDKDGNREEIRYFIQNGNLLKGVTKPTGVPYVYLPANEKLQTVVHTIINGGSGIFAFYDKNYDGTASSSPMPFPIDIAQVRLVKATVVIDADPHRSPVPMTFESQVTIRNLKDNL